jgi:hypothetical protein
MPVDEIVTGAAATPTPIEVTTVAGRADARRMRRVGTVSHACSCEKNVAGPPPAVGERTAIDGDRALGEVASEKLPEVALGEVAITVERARGDVAAIVWTTAAGT